MVEIWNIRMWSGWSMSRRKLKIEAEARHSVFRYVEVKNKALASHKPGGLFLTGRSLETMPSVSSIWQLKKQISPAQDNAFIVFGVQF